MDGIFSNQIVGKVMTYLVEDSLQFLSTELPHTYWDKEVIRNNLQSGILGNVLIIWPGQN